MSPDDDLEAALHRHFDQVAQAANPTADPRGPILDRVARHRTRHQRRLAAGAVAASVAVAIVVSLAGFALGRRATNPELATQAPTVTTAGPAPCHLTDPCQPTGVTGLSLAPTPTGYAQIASTPEPPVANQTRVETIYQASEADIPSPNGPTRRQIVLDAIVATPAETQAFANQTATWQPVTIGQRPARISITSVGTGPTAVTVGYLYVQVSPTVTVNVRADQTDQAGLVALGRSIVLE